MESVQAGELKLVSERVTERCSTVIKADRISVGLVNSESPVCLNRYIRTNKHHASDEQLAEFAYLGTFSMPSGSMHVDAHDVRNDPRTSAKFDHYFKPLGIASLLGVLIQAGKQEIDRLRMEQLSEPRPWETDEISFASQLADLLAITKQNKYRR